MEGVAWGFYYRSWSLGTMSVPMLYETWGYLYIDMMHLYRLQAISVKCSCSHWTTVKVLSNSWGRNSCISPKHLSQNTKIDTAIGDQESNSNIYTTYFPTVRTLASIQVNTEQLPTTNSISAGNICECTDHRLHPVVCTLIVVVFLPAFLNQARQTSTCVSGIIIIISVSRLFSKKGK